MLAIVTSTQFRKDVKLAKKRGRDLKKLEVILEQLANEQPLPARCRDHQLGGNWTHYRECHIEPDWLLIYRIDTEKQELLLARIGTHSDLF